MKKSFFILSLLITSTSIYAKSIKEEQGFTANCVRISSQEKIVELKVPQYPKSSQEGIELKTSDGKVYRYCSYNAGYEYFLVNKKPTIFSKDKKCNGPMEFSKYGQHDNAALFIIGLNDFDTTRATLSIEGKVYELECDKEIIYDETPSDY